MDASKQVHPVTRVEYYRRLEGIDQGLLGERIGTTRSFVSKVECGARELDSVWRERIADALGIDPSLLEEKPGVPIPQAPRSDSRSESRVRKARKERGWSQGKLAARTGIGTRRVAAIESGRDRATLEEALVLAEAFSCDVGEIFSGKEKGPLTSTKSSDDAHALIGRRYGSLTVLDILKVDRFVPGGRRAICRCDCGSTCQVRIDHLKSGHTASCGCQSGKRKGGRRHG